MNLVILLPSRVLANHQDVSRVVAETSEGSWGILPQRRDCVAILVPGVLMFDTPSGGVAYSAVDAGVLVKRGADVTISTRRGVLGTDLHTLRETVLREYAVLEQLEVEVRHVSEKLENGFLRRLVALHHD